MPATPMQMKRKAPTALDPPAKKSKGGVFVQNAPDGASVRGSQADIDLTKIYAKGTFRLVYKGQYGQGPRTGEQCVMKEFKSGSVWQTKYFDEDIKAVKKSGELIQAFNEQGLVNKTIYLNEPQVWTGNGGRIAGQKVLVEPMIKGEYFKFNSNTGYAMPDSDTMQALSHFSYHHSNGKYVVCDLQGGRYDGYYVLTDPVILSSKKEFGGGDLGQQGIDNFMAHHKCGRYCKPHWKMPKVDKLVPQFEAVSGTTFGTAVSLFKDDEWKKLQEKVRKCWEKHTPKKR